MPTIKPRIRKSVDSDVDVVITLPHALKGSVWSMLFEVQDHIISISSGGPTVINIKFNDGYCINDAVVISGVTVFCMMHYIDDLLKIDSQNELIEKINSEINIYGYEENSNNKHGIPQLDSLQDYFITCLDLLTSRIFKNIKPSIEIVFTDRMNDQISLAKEAKRRLKYVAWTTLGLTPFAKIRQQKDCDKAIEKMISIRKSCLELNTLIDGCKEECSKLMLDFHKELTELIPYDNYKLFYTRYQSVLEQHLKAEKILVSANFAEFKNCFNTVMENTPPAPCK